MKKAALYISVLLTATGCFSKKPDCDDVSVTELQGSITGFLREMELKRIEAKRDSLKAFYKEAGFNNMSIFEPKNPSSEYDSLKRKFYAEWAQLDSLEKQKLEGVYSLSDKIRVKETGELVYESAEMGLSTFHCDCDGKYYIDDESGVFSYRLTRRDFDSKTYRKVYFVGKAQ